MSRTLDDHFRLLHDARRLDAYAQAITSRVKSGDVVVDLGCGTGILGLIAARAGARRVYALERRGIIDSASDVGRDNGLADRIIHLAGESTAVTLPESADVVVGYQMGPLGFEAGLVQVYADAAQRFLRPNGCLIPISVETWIAPAQSAVVRDQIARWQATVHGFEFRRLQRLEANSVCELRRQEIRSLAVGQRAATLRLGIDSAETIVRADLDFTIATPGTFDGFCGWFESALTEDIRITSAPDQPERINRSIGFLPVEHPVEVHAGDRVRVAIGMKPALRLVEWRGRVDRNGAEPIHFNHNSLPGLAVDTLLAATRP